jgi:hypothetical protein
MKVVTYFALLFCCLASIYALNLSDWGTTNCAEYGLQKDAHYAGIVLNKWRDSLNHSYPMLRVALGGEQGGFSRDLNFLADTGNFYKSVAIGDSVKKKEGSLEVLIKRNDTTILIPLQPACN